MGSVVCKTDTCAQVLIAARVRLLQVVVHIVESVFGIVVVVHGILDGRLSNSRIPVAIPTGDEKHIVQIGRIRHGVLLNHQGFFEDILEFLNGFAGETAVEHVRVVVVGTTGHSIVIKVCHFASC